MNHQLRIYRVREGSMDEFIDLFRNHIVPAREAHGFTVVGAWVDRGTSTFAWVVSHPAPDGYDAVDRAYIESPARKAAMPRDPRELLQDADVHLVEALS